MAEPGQVIATSWRNNNEPVSIALVPRNGRPTRIAKSGLTVGTFAQGEVLFFFSLLVFPFQAFQGVLAMQPPVYLSVEPVGRN